MMKLATQTVQFNLELLKKYDQALPRYTSYPPATELKENFHELDLRAAIAVCNYKNTPLSLYFHIPFCETACYFCGCNTIITRKKEIADPYLTYVARHLQNFFNLISSKQSRRYSPPYYNYGIDVSVSIVNI